MFEFNAKKKLDPIIEDCSEQTDAIESVVHIDATDTYVIYTEQGYRFTLEGRVVRNGVLGGEKSLLALLDEVSTSYEIARG